MSIIRADSIKNRSGLGAPDFPNGITVTGIVTATTLNQNVTGIVTATSFVGDGSSLTGIDATALKDGSGNVIVQAGSLDVVVGAGKTFKPASTNSTDLGTANERWRVIYTNDLELSNKGSQNSVDGTWGDWTLQEGENDIFMINNRNGKKFKINLTEVSDVS